MLNTPGQDDHDGELHLDLDALGDRLDGGPEPVGTGTATSTDRFAEPVAAAVEDDCTPLDDEREQIGYELYHWDSVELDALDDAVHGAGLPHEWVSDGFEIVVHATDEAAMDRLVEAIRPVAADRGEVGDVEVAADESTDPGVLDALFVAVARLAKSPTGDGVGRFLDAASDVGAVPPYGIPAEAWSAIVAAVDDILDAFESMAPPAVVARMAGDLRERIRSWV